MIFDKKNMFCHNEDCQAGGLNDVVVQSDIVNIGTTGMKLGVGEPVFVGVVFNEALAGGTSVQFAVQHCDTVGGSYTDLVAPPAILLADADVGKEIKIPIPEGAQQFLRLQSTNVGTSTAGQITAGIVM